MVDDRDCRACARRMEANDMMAALLCWKALVLLAEMTLADQLRQRQAVAHLHAARSYLHENNSRAEALLVHGGVQRAFACFDPQLRFAA